jgi:threonine aldolase
MGNTIAIKLHTRHGEEVISDDKAHILEWELSMTAWFSGCSVRTVPTKNGVMSWAGIEPAIHVAGGFHAPTALVHVEHPHNMGGGSLYEQSEIDNICQQTHARGLRAHMDGARLFNAVAATGLPAARIVRDFDTVMFCLSKGLGAPVGSMLVGPAATIADGRRYRKHLGGGMRQAGVLAAAGLIALEESPKALAQDHANAKMLAQRLAKLKGIAIDPAKVVTNIVIFDIAGTGLAPTEFLDRLKAQGVLAIGIGEARIRLVTHYDVSHADCERAADVIEAAIFPSVA